MYMSRAQVFLSAVAAYIVLPVAVMLCQLFFGSRSAFDAAAWILFSGNVVFLLYKSAYWEYLWFYSRYALIGFFLLVSAADIFFAFTQPQHIAGFHALSAAAYALSIAVLYVNVTVLRASAEPGNCMTLSFPFKDGRYLVTDGGDGKASAIINYHYRAQVHKAGESNSSMRYATDIVKLGRGGRTVPSVLTGENEQYAIFHEEVFSPYDGIVHEVVDGIEDNAPFCGDFPYNVGNCVVLENDGFYIVIGHMEKGSLLVREGERVQAGQKLGVIGNSGLSPRPHVHMQVSRCDDGFYWGGEGVPIRFDRQPYPARNTVISVR